MQPIQHVWTHSDSDLVDLTLSYTSKAQRGKATPAGQSETSEVVHTTSEHPFLTDHGFVPAGKLKVGMRILREDGSVGIVTATRVVHRTQKMYNLEVAQDHTFVVGSGQWVVHNKCDRDKLRSNLGLQQGDSRIEQHLIPCQLESNQLVQLSGLDINSAENGAIVESNDWVAQAKGEIYHSGPHPSYTSTIEGLLNRRLADLTAANTLNQASALSAVLETIRDARYMIAAFNEIEAVATAIPLRLC